jgi:D-arabinose 1-dehydrogenase-like Zn-dependent alcohol dehydrogenase
MKAVRLHAYREPLTVDEVAEPELTGPHDVIVRVGGAGLCRTDLHMRDGWFVDVVPVDLPLTLGHETAGWVHAVGSAVEHVAVGDTVICYPNISCGSCPACWAGQTMRCVKGLNFPGITRDGGFAELVKTSARYDVVGYGGTLTIPTVQLVLGELQIVGSLVGTADDLAALVRLAAAGQVSVRTTLYPLDGVNDAISELEQGRVGGRAVLTPPAAA